jgi:hypothetical protein
VTSLADLNARRGIGLAEQRQRAWVGAHVGDHALGHEAEGCRVSVSHSPSPSVTTTAFGSSTCVTPKTTMALSLTFPEHGPQEAIETGWLWPGQAVALLISGVRGSRSRLGRNL